MNRPLRFPRLIAVGLFTLALAACQASSPGGPSGTPPGAPPGGGSTTVDHGTYVTAVTSNTSQQTYASTGDAQNAVRVQDGVTVRLDQATVTKTAGAPATGDASNFYGNNAGILVLDEAQATFTDLTVTTAAEGANGLFVYGSGTQVTVDGAEIATSGNSSGGIMVAGGGSATVTNAQIETQGRSSAPLRTDRGGGVLTVTGGTYLAHGVGSPAVYSTAQVTVSDAVLTATGSEAIVVEGKNSVTLVNTTVTGKMVRPDAENIHNVMIYQSMSGDASVGQGSFTMTGGSLTAQAGDQFYVTNTKATIGLTGVSLSQVEGVLLRVVGNDGRTNWGTVGANGGQVTFAATQQTLVGDIVVDAISSLDLSLAQGSTWKGSVNSTGDAGTVNLTLDSTSRWTLTADAHLTTFTGSLDRVDTAGYHLWVGGKLVK